MVQGYGEKVPLASPGRFKRDPFWTDGRGGPGGRDHGVLPGSRYHLVAQGKKEGKCSLNTIPVPGQLIPRRMGIGQNTPGSVRIISGCEGYPAPVPWGGMRPRARGRRRPDHGVLPGSRYHLVAQGKNGGKCSLNTIPVPGQLIPRRMGIGQITPGSVRIISGCEGYPAPVPGGGMRPRGRGRRRPGTRLACRTADPCEVDRPPLEGPPQILNPGRVSCPDRTQPFSFPLASIPYELRYYRCGDSSR